MGEYDKDGYYAARSATMLRGFDGFARRVRPYLEARYGTPFAIDTLGEARVEFVQLLPEIPYIGGVRNVFTPVVVANGWGVALYRAMAARGKTALETIAIIAELSDDWFRSMPGWLLGLLGRAAFSGPARWYFRRQGDRSLRRQHAGDFVWRLREGGGDDVAFEFDECAVNKFYEAQGVTELAPYCNFFDVTYSRLMGMGINADNTIGLGCETCTLAFKHGRETKVPANLDGVLPHAKSAAAAESA